MRLPRIGLLFIAIYFVFIGGAVYYDLVLQIRMFHHVAVTVLLGIWLLAKLRGDGLPQTRINTPLYLLVAAWFASAWFSIDRRMAFETVWFLVMHLVIFFILVDLFQRGRGRWVMEVQFFIGALIVLISGLELASWYFGLALGGGGTGWFDVRLIPLEFPPRLAWAMNSTNWLAGYVAPLVLVTGGWAYTARRADYRRVLWALAGLLLLVLIFTFTRGGYMSFAAGLGAFNVMRLAQIENIRERLSPAMMGGLLLVGAVVVLTGLVVVTVSGSRGSGDRVRIDLYESAIQMSVDYPALGVGPGAFGRAYRSYRTPELARDRMGAAHNAYLGIASEGGLVTLAISAWIGLLLLRTWWRNWRDESHPMRRIRLEVVYAALIGVGVHSMVDIFQRTPNVILIATLVAYSITGHRTVLDERKSGHRPPAAVLLVILLAYAAWFTRIDRAQSHYQNSLRGGEDSIAEAQAAADLDPGLNLYPLQIAYLEGEALSDDWLELTFDEADTQRAVDAYERAVELEPTWDTGWLNLAALAEWQGERDIAFEYAERAYAINPLNESALATARLAEMTRALDDDEIITRYLNVIERTAADLYLPLSDFWTATPLRREALERYLADEDVKDDARYRILIAQGETERAYALVSQTPQTAAQHWVAGQYALTVLDDPDAGAGHFSAAIELDRGNGDYYASRARALMDSDPDAARRDLDLATLLGTFAEYPNAIRAEMTDDPDEHERLLRASLPGRPTSFAFSAVLYGGRISGFDLFPMFVRYPGPGDAAMQPWFDLLAIYEAEGREDDAEKLQRAIWEYAWDAMLVPPDISGVDFETDVDS